VLEIAAARLLAPYVGVTLTTYTGIIGVILAGTAAGAWTGGRAADVYGPERLIGPTFAFGGAAAIASVPIVGLAGDANLAGASGDVLEVVLLATLGFVAPATILSAVAPMIVRATITDVITSGTLVGRLSAIGTVGAISGTFLTGFVLLGLVPTRLLIVGVGALLVLIGAGLAWRYRSGGPGSVILSSVLALAALGGAATIGRAPCDTETRYYCVAVIVGPGDADERTLVLDGLTHAFVDVADPFNLRFGYVRRFADVVDGVGRERAGALDALHLGGGGFSFPRYLEAAYPASRHTILELDQGVLDVARSRLGFTPGDRTRVIVGDARLSIRSLGADSFDVVVGDAFGGLAVPWHLTTTEFLSEVNRVLRPGGLYVMNLIDGPPFGFVRAEAATARHVFGELAVIARAPVGGLLSGGNLVIVASRSPIDVAGIRQRIDARAEGEATGILVEAGELDAFIGDSIVLTDDLAPVDQLLGR
jgi:SAM-dependent methyltransferase